MSLKLGINPERSVKNQLHNVSTEVVRLIGSQGIPVVHVDPNTYHIELFPLNMNGTLIPTLWTRILLRKYQFTPFDITINEVRLGSGGRVRELVNLQVGEGSDQLRDMVYTLAKRLRIRRFRSFDPSIRIARVSKDLSEQEEHNLINTIHSFNGISFPAVKFQFNGLSLLESKGGVHELRKFSI